MESHDSSVVPDGEKPEATNGKDGTFDEDKLKELHYERVHRLDDLPDGPYYIAPDSAPPFPLEMASRVDAETIPGVMQKMVEAGIIDEKGKLKLSDARDIRLINLGGEAVKRTLKTLRGAPNGSENGNGHVAKSEMRDRLWHKAR